MTGLYLRLKKVTTNLLKMGSVTVNEISTDGTMAGNSDTALPTEKAVKTYVDTKATLGLVNFKAAVGTSGVLAGASGAIPLSIPVGAWIIGVTMNNDVAITDDNGNDTYTAAFAGGLVANINGGDAITAAQNTKVKQIHGCTFGVTTGAVSIALTPNGSNFTGGEVSATVVYLTIEELADAA